MRSGKLQMIHFRDVPVRAGNLGPGAHADALARTLCRDRESVSR
jgi:hypothetical protein